jgi:hypothetical protein
LGKHAEKLREGCAKKVRRQIRDDAEKKESKREEGGSRKGGEGRGLALTPPSQCREEHAGVEV